MEALGTDVVGAVHYCIYLAYFACEHRYSQNMLLYLYVISTRGGGGGGCRGVLISVIRNHYGLLIHSQGIVVSYPLSAWKWAYLLSVLNIRIRCPHGFFIGICHPVSCQKLSYCCNCSLSLHRYMTPRGTKMYVGRRTNQIIGAPSIFLHPICENLNPLHIRLFGRKYLI